VSSYFLGLELKPGRKLGSARAGWKQKVNKSRNKIDKIRKIVSET